MEKQSKRLEFSKSDIKSIHKAAKLDGRSAKRFMELAVIYSTLQTIQKYEKHHA